MKRFYKLVSSKKVPEGYAIFLDDKAIKTKSGKQLFAPTEEIANKIVQEWAEQKDVINPEIMPFTQILNTKIDRVSKERCSMNETVLKYIDTDLLCYCVSEPEELVQLQEEKWLKWRMWAEEEFSCKIEVTTGLAALSQPKKLHKQLKTYVEALNDDDFTVLQIIVSLSGSLILGLSVLKEAAGVQDVFEACFLEERFKETLYDTEKYGLDPHMEIQQQAVLRDLQACTAYLHANKT